jgi:hypothetical protein
MREADGGGWASVTGRTYHIKTMAVAGGGGAGYTAQEVQELFSYLDPGAVAQAGSAHTQASSKLSDIADQLVKHAQVLTAAWSGTAAQGAVSNLQQLHSTAVNLSQASAQTGSVLTWMGSEILPYYKNWKPASNGVVGDVESLFGDNPQNTEAQQVMARLNDRLSQGNSNLPASVSVTLPPANKMQASQATPGASPGSGAGGAAGTAAVALGGGTSGVGVSGGGGTGGSGTTGGGTGGSVGGKPVLGDPGGPTHLAGGPPGTGSGSGPGGVNPGGGPGAGGGSGNPGPVGSGGTDPVVIPPGGPGSGGGPGEGDPNPGLGDGAGPGTDPAGFGQPPGESAGDPLPGGTDPVGFGQPPGGPGGEPGGFGGVPGGGNVGPGGIGAEGVGSGSSRPALPGEDVVGATPGDSVVVGSDGMLGAGPGNPAEEGFMGSEFGTGNTGATGFVGADDAAVGGQGGMPMGGAGGGGQRNERERRRESWMPEEKELWEGPAQDQSASLVDA